MRLRAVPLLLGILTGHWAFAQTAGQPFFEAASIRPNTGPGNGNGTVRFLPGRLRVENALVRYIIQNAFGVKPFEIAGGPLWIDSARYDIEATAAGEPDSPKMERMTQTLLEERFQLRVHLETREASVYTLSAAKSGLKLPIPKEGDCIGSVAGAPPSAGLQPCGRVLVRIQTSNASLTGARVEMTDLTRVLANLLWRPVIDRTGYAAQFDVNVEFAADDAIGLLAGPYRPDAAPRTPSEPGGVSIFTAFQQQLGLKLESARGPVELLVIDHIERPTPN
jgi:uncharacterized protein (TIGR03435 family)